QTFLRRAEQARDSTCHPAHADLVLDLGTAVDLGRDAARIFVVAVFVSRTLADRHDHRHSRGLATAGDWVEPADSVPSADRWDDSRTGHADAIRLPSDLRRTGRCAGSVLRGVCVRRANNAYDFRPDRR